MLAIVEAGKNVDNDFGRLVLESELASGERSGPGGRYTIRSECWVLSVLFERHRLQKPSDRGLLNVHVCILKIHIAATSNSYLDPLFFAEGKARESTTSEKLSEMAEWLESRP